LGGRPALTIRSYGVSLTIAGDAGLIREVAGGLRTSFAGRYIPTFEVLGGEAAAGGAPKASVEWVRGRSFRVVDYVLRDSGVDEYVIESPPPAPYVNESPYFFILQALSRLYVRAGLLMLTDAVSVADPRLESAALLLGYPHTGKSTLLALALASGLKPLTTENTLLKVDGGVARVVGGTGVLVYDPRVREEYGVNVPASGMTRHGYAVVDLRGVVGGRDGALGRGVPVKAIYLLYTSFSSRGADLKPVKGRKVVKTLWHFATAVVRGTDYYDPLPPPLTSPGVDEAIASRVKALAGAYGGRMFEAFGSHPKVLEVVAGALREA